MSMSYIQSIDLPFYTSTKHLLLDASLYPEPYTRHLKAKGGRVWGSRSSLKLGEA